jgi:hypothetical protein
LIQPGFGLHQFVICRLHTEPSVPPTGFILSSVSDEQFWFDDVEHAVVRYD